MAHAINPRTGHYYARHFVNLTPAENYALECYSHLTVKEFRELPYLSDGEKAWVDRFIQDGYGDVLLEAFVTPLTKEERNAYLA